MNGKWIWITNRHVWETLLCPHFSLWDFYAFLAFFFVRFCCCWCRAFFSCFSPLSARNFREWVENRYRLVFSFAAGSFFHFSLISANKTNCFDPLRCARPQGHWTNGQATLINFDQTGLFLIALSSSSRSPMTFCDLVSYFSSSRSCIVTNLMIHFKMHASHLW